MAQKQKIRFAVKAERSGKGALVRIKVADFETRKPLVRRKISVFHCGEFIVPGKDKEWVTDERGEKEIFLRKADDGDPFGVLDIESGFEQEKELTLPKEKTKEELEVEKAKLEADAAKFRATKAKAEKETRDANKPDETKEEKPKPKKLAKPCVRAEGDEGGYEISASAVYEDGEPASGITIRLLVSKLGQPAEIEDLVTKANGLAEYSLRFTESECDVTWQCAGHEGEIKNLYGPTPRDIKKIEIPEPTQDELSGSFWEVIKRAWKKNLRGVLDTSEKPAESGEKKKGSEKETIEMRKEGERWTI